MAEDERSFQLYRSTDSGFGKVHPSDIRFDFSAPFIGRGMPRPYATRITRRSTLRPYKNPAQVDVEGYYRAGACIVPEYLK